MGSIPPKLLYQQCIAALITVIATALASAMLPAGQAQAKTPGKTYCFRGYCHRVLTLAETQAEVGRKAIVSTSNYDDCSRDRFNPCGLTSSGAVFQAGRADNAASPIYPDGTIILVRHPGNQKSAVLRVNSAGPYHGKRLLDVSRAAAEVLGFKRAGVANLEVRILQAPDNAEATYKKNRVYPAVPGFIGAFASLDGATLRYGDLAGPAATALAGLISRERDPVRAGAPSITGNGIERTWLAKAVTFKPAIVEARQTRRIAAKPSRRDGRRPARA